MIIPIQYPVDPKFLIKVHDSIFNTLKELLSFILNKDSTSLTSVQIVPITLLPVDIV